MRSVSDTGVSVIVATARPDHMMDACATAIARAAARLSEPAELIIVDDRVLATNARRPAQDVIGGLVVRRLWSRDVGVYGQAEARNLGAAAARYDVIALTDDDTRPDQRWLEQGVRRLRSDPSLAGVEGAIRLDPAEPVDGLRSRLVVNTRGGACINASMFYRADAFRAVGGSRSMWSRPPTNFREDTDLSQRIMRAVGPIAFEPEAFVIHPAEPVDYARLVWLGRSFLADAMIHRLHPSAFPSLRRKPFARLRIRLATLSVLALPGFGARRTRRLSAATIAVATLAISSQLELELRQAGIRRSLLLSLSDTVRRMPRALVWSLAAGSARVQGEAMVHTGLVVCPAEPEPLGR